MKLSIATLIACHNRKEKTLQCLNSLYNCVLPIGYLLEVFLVDDSSTDGTSEAVRKTFPEVKLIHGDGNLYWNRGMHLAWETASKVNNYDFYLWLNDDTFLYPNALETIFNDYQKVNNNSIICGVCKSQLSEKITFGGYDKLSFKKIKLTGKPECCHYFNGNVVLVPQKVFQLIGNLDPLFHHSIGDFEYGLRAMKKGINSYITSGIVANCENNDLPHWCNPSYSLGQRIKIFYKPLGAAPFEHFIFAKRHYGYQKAIRNIFSNHLRLLFPNKWQKK